MDELLASQGDDIGCCNGTARLGDSPISRRGFYEEDPAGCLLQLCDEEMQEMLMEILLVLHL